MKLSHLEDESRNYRSKNWQKNKYIRDDDDAEFTDDEPRSTDKRNLQRTPSASSQKTDDSADTPSSDINQGLLMCFYYYITVHYLFYLSLVMCYEFLAYVH
jgi:hypothetical protein